MLYVDTFDKIFYYLLSITYKLFFKKAQKCAYFLEGFLLRPLNNALFRFAKF